MSRFGVFTREEKERWNLIVKSFSDWDIYYLFEYTESMACHGDGPQYLFYYEGETSRICYPVHKKDIADFPAFQGKLERDRYYDFSTPYGYGGPLVEGNFNKEAQEDFFKYYLSYCRENKIVTQFVRYHPLLQNQYSLQYISEISEIKETIFMELTDPELIIKNMDSKNRNMVRKAEKSGIEIFCDDGEHAEEFIQIYEKTMERLNARNYYFFEKSYYDYLRHSFGEYTKFFYAKMDQSIVSASIFFYNEQFMHYHLSGTVMEYRKYAPTNLLLYKAALWGNQQRIKKLHLGGGVGIIDSLFNFKKQFNKNGHLPFWIGRTIIDKEKYEYLLNFRQQLDPTFDKDNDYYIQYRR